LEGKDIIGCAQTGTGKTAAFAVPILQLLSRNTSHGTRKKFPRALIVTPTRELAIQIGESFHAYGRYTPIKHTVIYGGVNQSSQVSALNHGVDVIIATSGRLLDLIGQGYIHLDNIEIFVLDEADRMLDMGFIHDIKKILNIIPKNRQSLFFSATMPDQIIKLAEKILHNPLDVSVTPVSSTVEIISQKVIHVKKIDKVKLLLHVLNDKEIKNALVFTRTKYGADKLVRHLIKNNISAAAIHGDKAQNARQNALNSF
jgi:ATP-dependent RNA helicase RhlE